MLSFRDSPNYEAPADASGDNEYRVTVQASDGDQIGQTGYFKVTVNVTDREETGKVTWNGRLLMAAAASLLPFLMVWCCVGSSLERC